MRNPDLKRKRDKRLVRKFYELYDVKRMRMDDVLEKLSDDLFYLDPDYIYTLIFYNKENKRYYDDLLNSNCK
jgi:hypothetical protein